MQANSCMAKMCFCSCGVMVAVCCPYSVVMWLSGDGVCVLSDAEAGVG